ncbi:hypothetical protein ACVMGC_005510 [Bradyrhizobium barranii subsp. barranii]
MVDIPHAPLSDALQSLIGGRRLVSAVFLTFKFDPAFFEQEILPVLFDVPLSHAAAVRLVQLEDALRTIGGEVAVYYDAKGLITTGAASAKLDVRRVPIAHRTGIFHPKNVFLLLESLEVEEDGSRERSLCAVSLSANLTRAGWWENVEVCHFEELREGERTLLRADIIDFLEGVRRRALAADNNQRAIVDILSFVRRDTEARTNRSAGSELHTRLYSGSEPFLEFLESAAGSRLREMDVELISPYFDESDDCAPLLALIGRFKPKEVRVFLPEESGGVNCREALFDSVRALRGVTWGKLPVDRTRAGGSSAEAKPPRFVHAKVYRFISRNPARELLFIGSVNLTSAAHQRGGNFESGFLVEIALKRRPEFWLQPEKRKPSIFNPKSEADELAEAVPAPLVLRYNWPTKSAEALWLSNTKSPFVRIEARGVAVGWVEGLPARVWAPLGADIGEKLGELLEQTSFVTVTPAGSGPATILVQEEGMDQKPSLLFRLSIQDILRYWATLSPAQRAAFIESKWQGPLGDGADLVARLKARPVKDTLFDRFAGVFHAFSSLEKSVKGALKERRFKDAQYRLFGKKYDSLQTLLERLAGSEESDDVERYVIALCAVQLVKEIKTALPEFWSDNKAAAEALAVELDELTGRIRRTVASNGPSDMAEFLSWFDGWFVERAKPAEESHD